MKKFENSSNYISHLRRLASIMNSSTKDSSYRSPQNYQSERKSRRKIRQRFGEKETKWEEYKQNLRIAQSIITKPGVVNFQKTQQHFQRHLRIRKLRTLFPLKKCKHKQIVISDVIWKNEQKQKDQILEVTNKQGLVMKMSHEQLKNETIPMDFGQSIELLITGCNKKGKISVKDSNIVPIVYKGKGVGTAIINILYH